MGITLIASVQSSTLLMLAELWCVPVAQLVEHQVGKLEICGSNPSLDTNFSLNVYFLISHRFTFTLSIGNIYWSSIISGTTTHIWVLASSRSFLYFLEISQFESFSGVRLLASRPTPNLEGQVICSQGFRPLDQLPSPWLQSLICPSQIWGFSSASAAFGSLTPHPPLEPLDFLIFWVAS